MADKKISQLPQGTLTSATVFPVVAGGITSQVTYQDIQDGFTGGTSGGGNSYVRGWEIENENGNSVTLGKGLGKITLTNGSNAIVAIGGADFLGNNVGSAGYNGQFTVIIGGVRKYIGFNQDDAQNGSVYGVFNDNQGNDQIDTIWTYASGDYEYFPYWIPETSGEYSFAEGMSTTASGYISHAEGYYTLATNEYAHAEGNSTQATGQASHAEGQSTIAGSFASHAQNYNTQANGQYSHSGGYTSTANGEASFVHGYNSNANGNYTIVLGRNISGNLEDTTYVDRLNIRNVNKVQFSGGTFTAIGIDGNGFVCTGTTTGGTTGGTSVWEAGIGSNSVQTINSNNNASGPYSVAEGLQSQAIGYGSHAQGFNGYANGQYSHVEGSQTQANGQSAHAEGQDSVANGLNSHAEGQGTIAYNQASHSEGWGTEVNGIAGHAEGYQTHANGDYSHAEGEGTNAGGQGAHAEGFQTNAVGRYSHAEGEGTLIPLSATAAHAEGHNTTASGNYSHTEGSDTQAQGISSHAEGQSSIASGNYSHAEGQETRASGNSAHAEGNGTIAGGDTSHAEGSGSQAIGSGSHAEGYITLAQGNYSHAGGVGFSDGKVFNRVKAVGEGSFNHSTNTNTTIISGATGASSAILGGTDHNALHQNSVILGGQGITTNASDTVFADNLELTKVGSKLILKSPNGTRYVITVNDAGVLSTVLA
jgi:hypothetical protein